MSFILKIFFSGLIAFVPSEDGKELTVLLLNAGHTSHTAGAPVMREHKAMLLARGGLCEPDCPTRDVQIAKFLYPEVTSPGAADQSLGRAVQGGAVWQLGGSQLSFGIPEDGVKLFHSPSRSGKTVPQTAEERADFRWVASLKEIHPAMGSLNSALLTQNPPGDLVVARLRLRSGTVSTYSVVQINGKVMPIDFHPVARGAKSTYVRAVADWVQAEIRVPGESVEIVESSFSGKRKRSMTLTPHKGVVEVAVLNISQPFPSKRNSLPAPGTHFARYWELAERPPANDARPIPHAPQRGSESRTFEELHPDRPERDSDLLDGILFPGGRGPYNQLLCPMSQYP